MGGIVRQADLVLLVADLSSDEMLDEIDGVLTLLAKSRIRLQSGEDSEADPGVTDFRRTLMVANKCDARDAGENLEILKEFFESRFRIFSSSAISGEGLDLVKQKIFEQLNIIRIYTKTPGRKADFSSPPFVLKRGSTVLDAARTIHREFVHSLKFARIWTTPKSRHSVKYEGQMVERSHQLEDGDMLELHL